MAALDFPASPTVGQQYPSPAVAGVPVYTWDGEKWTTKGGAIGSTGASDVTPAMNSGSGGAGSSTLWSRGDHIHPSDTSRVSKGAAGDTMSGQLVITANSGQIVLNGSVANQIEGRKGTGRRWIMSLGDPSAESGGNAGSDFTLIRSDDGGVQLGAYTLRIQRSDGQAIWGGDLNVTKVSPVLLLNKTTGAAAQIAGAFNGLNRWNINLGHSGAESSGDVGSDFTIGRWTDAGAFNGNVILISRATAAVSGSSIATAAEYRNNTAGKILTTDQVWAAASTVPLTDAASVAPDFSSGINFVWNIGGAGRTLAAPTSVKNGQCGTIRLINVSGTVTTFDAVYKFPGGIKPVGVVGQTDIISYFATNSTTINCTFNQDFK